MTAHEAIASPQLARLTAKDFLLLSEAGAFEGYARAELIEGEIWVVNAIHRRHARVHAALVLELGIALRAIGSPLVLYANPSTELSDHSLPEPDIVVAEADGGKMVAGPEVRLAIEISDSTLDMDLTRKARLYARYGVPEYWVVDASGGVIHQMWSPDDGTYRKTRDIAFGEPVAAATLEALVVQTSTP